MLTALIATAFAAPHEEAQADVEKAQMPFFPPMLGMMGMGMGGMGMGGMGPMMMGPQQNQYPVDYSKIFKA